MKIKEAQQNGLRERIALVSGSLLLSVLLAEFLLRLFFPIDTGRSREHRIPHPVLGWVLEAGASYHNHLPEATVQVTYNDAGWRDVAHSFEKPPGTFRILVLGDSYMEAYSVELEEAFHRQLQRVAQDHNKQVEVINLGVGGFGTLQQYLVFEEVGKRYDPDLVLLGFYLGNDVTNNSLTLEQQASADSLKITSRPFLDPADSTGWTTTQVDFEGAQQRYTEAKARQNVWLRRLARRSVLYGTVTVAQQNWRRRPAYGPQPRAMYMASFGPHFCEEPPAFTEAWTTTRRVLDRLNQAVDAQGSTLVVFSVPAWHEVDPEPMATVQALAPDPTAVCLEEAPGYTRLATMLHSLSIPYVDLLPDFRHATRESKNTLFRRSDRHWNPEGHAQAATVVGSYLLQSNLLLSDTPSLSPSPDTISVAPLGKSQ